MSDLSVYRSQYQSHSSVYIKYLKTFGFNISNETFAEHSWYFRNALVRENYNDLQNGIHATVKNLELFFKTFWWMQGMIWKSGICMWIMSLKELEIIKESLDNPSITQKELARNIGFCIWLETKCCVIYIIYHYFQKVMIVLLDMI